MIDTFTVFLPSIRRYFPCHSHTLEEFFLLGRGSPLTYGHTNKLKVMVAQFNTTQFVMLRNFS